MAEDNNVEKDSAAEDVKFAPISDNRRKRNYMILALIFGLVAIIWIVTMLKLNLGA